MVNSLFDIEDGKVVPSKEVYLIPEFKKLLDTYEDGMAALWYIYAMTSPESPYQDVPEDEKQQIVSTDSGGDFGFEDEEIEAALKKAEFLYTTPTRRFFLDAKIGLEKMGKYLRTSQIESGRDGNDTTYLSMLKSLGTITKSFKELEKEYTEEVSSIRGGYEMGYDEDE